MSEPKRAKFSHPQVSRFPTLEAPKTSEYAFFKKLRKDIGGTKSHPLHKEKIQSNISKVNCQNRETSTYPSILRSSSRSEKEGPSSKFAFLLPNGIESNNSGTQTCTSSGIKLSRGVFGFDQNLFPSSFAGVGKNLGNQYAEKGVFPVKRQRLRQLASDLFPEARECNFKGFDLVSALISRLLPRGDETEKYAQNASNIQDGSCQDDVPPRYQLGRLKEGVLSKPKNNETEYSNSKGRMIYAEYPSADSLKLDTPEKTFPQNAFKIQDELCWDDVFPNYQSSRPRVRVRSKWDMTTSDLPCINYYEETDFQDEEANYKCHADSGSIQYTFPESDSSFCISFENFRHSGADHIEQLHGFPALQLDSFHARDEGRREARTTLLLSWDVKDDEGKNSYSASGNSSDFACQQVMDDKGEKITACSSSLYPSYSQDFLLRPYIHSTCAYMHDVGRSHEEDSAAADGDIFPLLSLPPKHHTVEEAGDILGYLENSNINLTQEDPIWCTSKDTGKKDDFEALLLSRGLDIDVGWKFLSKRKFVEYYSSNNGIFQFPLKEDKWSYAVVQDEETVSYCSSRERTFASYDGAIGIDNWSPASSNVSLGERMDHPLLLDYPNRDRTEGVTYFSSDIQRRSS